MLEVTRMLRLARGEQARSPRAPHRYQAQDAPPVIVWNVCRHCNMTCPHCYAAASSTPSRQQLSTDEGKALIEALARGGSSQLIFSGGEPLLREDLFELIAHARENGLTPHLSTNGVLITPEVAQTLKSLGVVYVGVSIDGRPEFNDTYRGLSDGYRRALDGLLNAKAAGIRTGLRITVTQENSDHVEHMFEEAQQNEINRFYVSHLVWAGRARSIVSRDLEPLETRRLVEELFELADKSRGVTEVVTGGNDSSGAALVLWIAERYGIEAARQVDAVLTERGGNSAGEKILNIDHRGEVHPDQFWRQASLGNVRTHTWDEILAHPLRQELKDRVNYLEGRCGECAFVGLCRGSHRERSVALGTGVFGPDPSCLLLPEEVLHGLNNHRGAA